MIPTVMMCPAGLFFNDDMDVVTCVNPTVANCPSDAGKFTEISIPTINENTKVLYYSQHAIDIINIRV